MIEAVARDGYTATTVAGLTALAGVTKKSLYRHFDDKLDCFLVTYDLVVGGAAERIQAAYRGDGALARDELAWHAGLCRAFDAFAEELSLRPKHARLALVEALAVGPAALPRIERGEAIFTTMLDQSLRQAPDGVALPSTLLRGIVGGIWYVARSRLLIGEQAALSDVSRELLQWLLSYRSPAIAALERTARSWRPSPVASATAARAASDRLVSAASGDRMRMLQAAAALAAREGYETLTRGEIAQRAGACFDEFVQEFASVEDCFLSAVELLAAQALAGALRAGDGAPDWPRSAHRVVVQLLRTVAADRVFARTAFFEVFAAGPIGAARRAALMGRFAAVLERHLPAGRTLSPVAAEAITGAVWQLAHRAVVHDRARALPALAPYASYLTLAPVVGAERAVEAIAAEQRADAAAARRRSRAAAPLQRAV